MSKEVIVASWPMEGSPQDHRYYLKTMAEDLDVLRFGSIMVFHVE